MTGTDTGVHSVHACQVRRPPDAYSLGRLAESLARHWRSHTVTPSLIPVIVSAFGASEPILLPNLVHLRPASWHRLGRRSTRPAHSSKVHQHGPARSQTLTWPPLAGWIKNQALMANHESTCSCSCCLSPSDTAIHGNPCLPMHHSFVPSVQSTKYPGTQACPTTY